MKIFQEQRRLRRFVFSPPVLFIFLVVTLLLFISASRMIFRAYEAHETRKRVEQEYQAALAQKERLEERIRGLESPEGVEREAKERFNLKKPGEEVLIIVESKESATRTPERNVPRRFFEFVKRLFQ